MIGQTLAHYRVTSPIGAGGMGEVYRATDTTLGRDVALKVLPPAFAADPDRLARFEREAKLLATLNHPNIAQIYGFEQAATADGTTASLLVMELVEGEDLVERFRRGPVPVDEAIPIARQIADALEEAHAKGIVHRDLKPGNVKLTPEGRVKVLDFGLAKAWSGSEDPLSGSAPALSQSPTLAHTGTAAGLILGTAAYMSPEQARARGVDKRSDIWAFGVVLFEMLTGRRLFDGETVSDVLASVLKTEPDWKTLPADVPPAIRQLLRRCLERDPRRRLHDIADARIVIEDAGSGEGGADAPAHRAPWRTGLSWLALAVLAIAGAFLAGRFARPSAAPAGGALRLAIHLPSSQELITEGSALLVFSPDGGSLVFAGRENGRQSLFRRRLTEATAEPIPGTDGADSPFFSPDGRWIGFVAENRMWKVATEGGRPFQLAEAQGAGGAAWLADGTIVYAPIYSDGLFRVSADGGASRRLTTPDRKSGELGHWWPTLLPGGHRLLFTAFRTPVDRSRVGVLDLATGEVRWLVDGGFFGRYVASGHLLYSRGQRLYAQPFDPASGTVQGPAVAVLDDVRPVQTGGYAQLAVSSRGTLAYVTESLGNPLRELIWLDRSGHAVAATAERRRYMSASLSPDDSQAALTIQGDSQDLWVLSLLRGTLSRLTAGEATEFDPRWSSDGRELFYVVDRPPFELHRIALGAVDSGRPLWNEPAEIDTNGPAVSPDGRTIAFARSEAQTGSNLYWRPIDGSAPARPIRATRAGERSASFSPDGRFVVYHSDETGRPEIYVAPFPGPGEPVQVSADGGSEPLWARNGEIFYRLGDELRVVETTLAPRLSFAAPRSLFRFRILSGSSSTNRTYDLSRDGSRILAITVPPDNRPRQIEVVTNWAADLARLAPSAGR